jgi:hypothetical protein
MVLILGVISGIYYLARFFPAPYSLAGCKSLIGYTVFVTSQNSYVFQIVLNCRCGNVAAILELDENLNKQFRVFEAAPHVRVH